MWIVSDDGYSSELLNCFYSYVTRVQRQLHFNLGNIFSFHGETPGNELRLDSLCGMKYVAWC